MRSIFDPVPRQPAQGTTRRDAQGRRWVKARALPRHEWASAFLWAVGGVRTRGLTDDDVRAMGYELVEAT